MRQASPCSNSVRSVDPGALVPIEPGRDGFVVWSVSYEAIERALLDSPGGTAREISRPRSGIALGVSSLTTPSAERTGSVGRFVDELQSLGIPVVLHGAGGGFLAALQMEGAAARFVIGADLADAVRTLRLCDEMRRRCVPERGRRLQQLRMPAHAMSLAPLCLFLRNSLEQSGVSGAALDDLMHESYAALARVLEDATGAEDIAASAAAHSGVATVTILDSGKPRGAGAEPPRDGRRVDTIHSFRIPERHNALVLEKRLV
jgi:hypothetical protein